MQQRLEDLRKLFGKKSASNSREAEAGVGVLGGGVLEGMWSAVTPCDADTPAPSARAKHSATLHSGAVYLFGGRNGNVPLKDFWKYDLADGKWTQLKPSGDKPPCLQEHTAVAYRDAIYIFGGELGFSSTETPLWVYDVRHDTWRKMRSRKGVSVPRGRRGHTALVHRGSMLVYGGYQDLRGSCTELWAFHFETESWHLITSTASNSRNDTTPPPRHKHSAIIHEDAMWVYGGMTDLQERADLWRWDTLSKAWCTFKLKNTPGPLHSHAACRLPSAMVLFGGESNGHSTNDLWKFHFDTEQWEKIQIDGLKPQPRAECVAFAVSELLLKDNSGIGLETRVARTRSRTQTSSTDRNTKPSSYMLPQNKVSPYEKTYVFRPSGGNYTDGSNETETSSGGFLREISKLSQLNLSRLSHNKCSYTVLTTGNNDSTESLLRQHSTVPDTDSESTPTKMTKSRSAYAIKKKIDIQETNIDSTTSRNTKLNSEIGKLTREPISVPNFSTLVLPTPVLTPVEATRLVYLESDDEDSIEIYSDKKIINVQEASPQKLVIYENFKSVKRGESYNSHLGYADNPLYQHMVQSNSIKFDKCPEVTEASDDNISTSGYASIETMNRLSSSSSYNTSRQQTPLEEQTNSSMFRAKSKIQPQISDGPFGFCNPNYLGPDIQMLLANGKKSIKSDEKKKYQKMLNTTDPIDDALGKSRQKYYEDNLELQNMVNTEMSKGARRAPVPRSLELEEAPVVSRSRLCHKVRASSASRVERHSQRKCNNVPASAGKVVDRAELSSDLFVPLYVFIVGGKEQGQVTVFKRPVSIWKLKLF